MDNLRNGFWRRSGPGVSACAALVLLTACSAPSPPASSSEGSAGSAPQAPADRRAGAPPPVPVPQTTGTANAAGVRAPVSSLASLEEHALAVRAYGAEEPSRCGLKAPGGASPPSSVQVFFGCNPQSGPVVPAVPARVVPVPAGGRPERAAIEALLAGPTADESRAGYVSNFGNASRGVEFEVEVRNNGLAVINFDQAIRDRARAFVSNLDAHQVVATLGQLPGVQRVLILVEGEPLCKALGEC